MLPRSVPAIAGKRRRVQWQYRSNGYLFGRGQSWFAYAMTVSLMIFDYVDRQVIVSLFPFLKADGARANDLVPFRELPYRPATP
jgi:hypothetical protein